MATRYAPRACASVTNGHWCRLVETRLAPHSDDQPGLDDGLRLEPDRAPEQRAQRGLGRRGADRGAQAGRAEVGEQALAHRPALHVTHRAGEVVRQDGRRPVALDGGAQPGRDPLDRLRPAGPPVRRRPDALGPDPDHRVGQPVGPVDRVQVPVDLAAQRAPGERVVAVAGDGHRPAVLHGQLPGAGVRAVERAGAQVRRTAHLRMLRPAAATRQRRFSAGWQARHRTTAPCRQAPRGGTLWMKEA